MFHNQEAYNCIDSAGKKLYLNWNIIEFEKTVFGNKELILFHHRHGNTLKIELSELNPQMPFLKFDEPGQHYAHKLFLSEPDRSWGLRGVPFLWAYMVRQFTNDKLPMPCDEIIKKAKSMLHELGIDETSEENVYIKRFAAGGLSSGIVTGKYFMDVRLLKMLMVRLT